MANMRHLCPEKQRASQLIEPERSSPPHAGNYASLMPAFTASIPEGEEFLHTVTWVVHTRSLWIAQIRPRRAEYVLWEASDS